MKNSLKPNEQQADTQIQEWLIAFALMIVIPTTVYLGVGLVAPKVDFNQYYQKRNDFFKDYNRSDLKKYQERETQWQKTKTATSHESNKCGKKGLMLFVSGPISVGLLFLGSIFTLPVISMSLLITGVNVFLINFFMYAACDSYMGFNIVFIEMLFALAGLLVVLWFAYQSSERKSK